MGQLVEQGVLSEQVDVVLERPKSRDHGDYSTNIALVAAKVAGMNPRELATLIAERLAETPGITSAEVAGPGFINIRLSAESHGNIAREIVSAGASYGRSNALSGRSFNV